MVLDPSSCGSDAHTEDEEDVAEDVSALLPPLLLQRLLLPLC